MPKMRHVAVMLELQSNYRRHTEIYAGAQLFAEERGWKLTIDEFADDTLASCDSQEIPYDGIIARATKSLLDVSKRRRIPIVNVWLNSPVKEQLPGVFPDFAAVGRLNAEHLLARGFYRFAALTCNTFADDHMWEAFAKTIRDAGYSCTNTKVPLDPTKNLTQWKQMQQIITASLDTWQFPIGIWCYGDYHGRMLAQICTNRGLRIPADVAIIAGHNEETFCLPRPSLTSGELGIKRIGYEAARLLGQAMSRADKKGKSQNAGKRSKPNHVILPPEGLVLRASTDFFAVEDKLVGLALEFIAANSHRPINVDEVAQAVATEPRTLQRRFRKHLKRPIAAEIRRVRIERAKRELVQSDRSISEIARSVGFAAPMRMYEVFRREIGISPKEYRNQRRVHDEG